MEQDVTRPLTSIGQPRYGLYTPDDMLWRVNREGLIGLGGARALFLELAHPQVAAGVAEHSDFRRRPLRRLFNTVKVMQLLSFGDEKQMRSAARHNHQAHQPVKGNGYDANDPALRLWVFATLIDSILMAHDIFIRPLSVVEKARYYEDSKRMARMLAIPASVMPATFMDFRQYMQTMIYGGKLAVGDQAREIVSALFSHRLFGGVARLSGFFGIGMLPQHLRVAFGFEWDEKRERRFQWWTRLSQRARRKLPALFYVQPLALWREKF